jgi:hypothetical protein
VTDRLPSVTELLSAAGLVGGEGFRFYTLEGRDRGTAVHLATAFLDDRDLDWSSLHPSVVPRVRQYQRFLDVVRPEILAVEEEVVNATFGYIGHVDRRLRINGTEAVLDLKSPSKAAWHAIQLSLYAAAYPRPMARFNLYLGDQTYQLVQHRDPTDWTVAKAAITVASWRSRNGI